MLRIVALISGGGSTCLRVLKETKPGGILHGLVEVVAIITDDFLAKGLAKAMKEAEFPKKHIWPVNAKIGGLLAKQLLLILDYYRPNYFYQLGWMPRTPKEVIDAFPGLNQHLGPGGQFMYGERRLWAHREFCKNIGEERRIPIFCQCVHQDLDQGDVVIVHRAHFIPGETIKQAADRLLPLEHEVQVEALRRLAIGMATFSPVPTVFKTPEEKVIMDQCRVEANEHYKKLEA